MDLWIYPGMDIIEYEDEINEFGFNPYFSGFMDLSQFDKIPSLLLLVSILILVDLWIYP